MTLFTCPICAAPLQREEGRYLCPNRHSYDLSREGYVHLLPANKKHSKDPGDDKAMAAAVVAEPVLRQLARLPRLEFLDVPDPRAKVLALAAQRACSVKITVTDPSGAPGRADPAQQNPVR